MSDHNYTGCQEPLCRRCEDHSAGYRYGKSKALFEVSTRTTDHPPGCGCDPCRAVRERPRRRGGFGEWPHLDEASMSEPDPDRPERGGGLDVGLALVLGIELGEGDLP